MKPDWSMTRDHYEQTEEPLRALAVRFGDHSTLFKRAAREEWKQTRSVSKPGVEATGSNAPEAASKIGSRDAAIKDPVPVALISSARAPKLEANGSTQPVASKDASTPECETGSRKWKQRFRASGSRGFIASCCQF